MQQLDKHKRRMDVMYHEGELLLAYLSTIYLEEYSAFRGYDSLTYVLKGSITHYNQIEEFTAKAGDLFFTSRYADYSTKRASDPLSGYFECIVMKFDADFATELEYSGTKPELNFMIEPEDIMDSMMSFYKAFQQPTEPKSHEFLNKRQELQEIILKKAPTQLASLISHRTDPFLRYLNDQITKNTTLKEIASELGMSLSTFQRHFKKYFQTSPHQWIRNQRLNYMRIQMQLTQEKISNLYLDLGYEDLAHASKAFKKKYGFTPSETYDTIILNLLKD